MTLSTGKQIRGVAKASRRLTQRRGAAVLLVGLTSLTISIYASLVRWPLPKIHDEFSYLLMADTFAEGRLTNPPHAAWESLESFHIIQQPTYASKYPVGQGLVLAFGQVVFGEPIVGVWLSTAFACAAVCWMLQGWVSPRWAFWGGLLFTLQGGIQFDWGQSFWGGSVALAGGALLFGAAPRLLKQISVKNSLCLAAGLVILANSRPFEGLIVAVIVSAWLFGTWVKRRELFRRELLTRFLVPTCLCLTLAGLAMAYYNYRVTGSPLKMPYKVYQQTYSIASIFAWKEIGKEPDYRHTEMRDFYRDYGLARRHEQSNLFERIRGKADLVPFFATPAIALPLLLTPFLIRRRTIWFPALVLLIMGSAALATYSSHAHYYAPVAPLLTLMAVTGLRYIAILVRRGAPVRWMIPTLAMLHVAAFLSSGRDHFALPAAFREDRMRLQTQLEQSEGKHLVLVRYAPDHCGHDEWVYNRADIGAAKVVWAREMEPAGNARTLAAFRGRKVWSLEADRLPQQLVPFAERTSSSLGDLRIVLEGTSADAVPTLAGPFAAETYPIDVADGQHTVELTQAGPKVATIHGVEVVRTEPPLALSEVTLEQPSDSSGQTPGSNAN